MSYTKLNNITIGSDPELFLINTKTGKVVSSIGIIPGFKGDAWRSKDMPKGFGLQIDNILAEFNIPPVDLSPSGCTGETTFINNIDYMKDFIRKYVKEKNPDLDILCAASQIVDEDQLQSPEALEFGCSPDYNVYTERPNPSPEVPKDGLRSAGFHIHIGYDKPNTESSLFLVRCLDITLGLMSTLLDDDDQRRKLYGKAGAFRLTPYGVEYRVLSSYFLSEDDLLSLVWDGVLTATQILYYNESRLDRIIANVGSVDQIINERDIQKATQFLKEISSKINYTKSYTDRIFNFQKNKLCVESGV